MEKAGPERGARLRRWTRPVAKHKNLIVAVRENQVAVVIDSEGGEVDGLPETDEQVYDSASIVEEDCRYSQHSSGIQEVGPS